MRERASNQGHISDATDPAVLENGQADIEMVTPGGHSVTTGADAPTQEDEDEAIRRRRLGRRIIECVFPYFTRPVTRRLRRASQTYNGSGEVEHGL